MRKLQRGNEPACLLRYSHGKQVWRDLAVQHRADIWESLAAMQGNCCAYCEASVCDSNRHIEHFRQRDREPRMTFHWPNLFGSCNHQHSCGRHKDGCGVYDPDVLIKPDVDEPGDYWIFASDGTIRARAALDDRQRHRATESLRIFNLDALNGRLRHKRREAARPYLETAQTLAELADELSEQEFLQVLGEELAAVDDLPFSTAIRHVLLNR